MVTHPRTYSVDEVILLVAGRAGGLKPGGHLASAGAHPVRSSLGCMQAVGYQPDQLGEVLGALVALR